MNLQLILDRTRGIVRRKHLAYATEAAYCHWIRRYATFVRALQRPALTSEQKFERFLTQIAKRGCSASTQNQAFNAINFLYREVLQKPLGSIEALRVRMPAHVRVAPSPAEVAQIIETVEDQHGYPIRLLVKLLYGCGLRVREPLNLRVKDVRLTESELVIRDAKGGKDRVVALPCSLVPALKAQLQRARLLWEQDQLDGVPVPLPGALARKYPSAAASWQWYWLFPASRPCVDPRTRHRVRWRCHEAVVQRAVKAAAVRRGLDSVVTPHVLRHAYATHAMREGAYVRDVQVVMGHSSLETTMGYLHTEAGRVKSPLETLTNRLPQSGGEPHTRVPSVENHFRTKRDADGHSPEIDFLPRSSATRDHMRAPLTCFPEGQCAVLSHIGREPEKHRRHGGNWMALPPSGGMRTARGKTFAHHPVSTEAQSCVSRHEPNGSRHQVYGNVVGAHRDPCRDDG